MGKYFLVQLKRTGRLIPLLILSAAVLFAGIYLAYQGLVSRWEQDESFQKLKIAVIGTMDDRFLQMALDKTMDDSNFPIDFVEMEEPQAVRKLERGEISAYLVFPEDFLGQAMDGEIMPIRFVSTAGGVSILSLVKDEFAGIFAQMLLSSEKGAYALDLALRDYDRGDISWEKMNELAYTYAEAIFQRENVYAVEELGISAGLSFAESLLSGLWVLFLSLLTLPFAPVMVRQDFGLQRILKSRGIGGISQTVCEFGAYFLYLGLLSAFPAVFFRFGEIFFGAVVVVFSTAAGSYLIYSLCSDLLSGVLLQFFLSVGMCFVCGCMYPVDFFPIGLQKLSAYLPAAVARNYMANLLFQRPFDGSLWLLIAMGFAALCLAVGIRCAKIAGKKETAV